MNEEYKYYCDKCKFYTNVKVKYTKHLDTSLHITGKRKPRSDRKQEIYKCNKCDYSSKTENNYKSHYLNNHGTKEEKKKGFKYYCEKCDFGTFIEQCHIIHIETEKHKIKVKI